MTDFEFKVYSVVSRIPEGKVATYGQIAKLLGRVSYSRSIGNALHKNPEPSTIPCHRVVKSDGSLAERYAFGGIEAQKQKLINEGVEIDNYKVNLIKYRW